MDPIRFDRLARMLAASGNRRTVVRTFAAGLLAGAFSPRGAAARARRELGDHCRHHRQCPRSAYCIDRVCACLATETDCAGRCYDLDTNDGAHCGACDAPCPEDHSCIRRVCTPHGTVPRGSRCARTVDCVQDGGPIVCSHIANCSGGGCVGKECWACRGTDNGNGNRATCVDGAEDNCQCDAGTRCRDGRCRRV